MLKSNVAIYGGFAGAETEREERDWETNETVIDGANTRRCVVGANEAVIDGFTITRGKATGNAPEDKGAGIYNESSSPVLANCTFTLNTAATAGGGMYNTNFSSPALTNCTFTGNTVTSTGGKGGGVYNNGTSCSPTFTDCTFTANSAGGGAGLYNASSSPTVANCTFTSNAAARDGSGMSNNSSSPTVINCIFVLNTVTPHAGGGGGGGMGNWASSAPTVTNCIFMSNSSAGGAGIHNDNSSPVVTNCTFVLNVANQGGGVRNWQSSPVLKNCILWGNTASSGPEIYNDASTPNVTYSCVQGGYTGTGNISTNPLFVSLTNNVRLQSGSPCINTGTATGAPATDIDGTARPQGAGYDMGAYESIVHTLMYTAGTGGSISGASTQTVNEGGSGTAVTAVPGTGYHFDRWSDGILTATRTDTNITADISVTASFAVNTYTLTYTSGVNGSISGTSPQTVSHGGSGTPVTAVPDAHHHFVRWSDGSTDNPRTDTSVATNISVTASFAIDSYTLTYMAGAGGTISGTSPQTVDYGGSGSAVTAVPDTGYHFVRWSDGVLTAARTDTGVTGDIALLAEFSVNTYTLTYTAGANGSISGNSPQTVDHGGSGTAVTAVPDAYHHFVQWNDGSTQNPRTDTYVTANISVTAIFALNTYTLTYTAGSGGSVSGNSPQTVDHGGSGTAVTAVPDTGYHFVRWSDGVLTATRTDSNVIANLAVTAEFAQNILRVNIASTAPTPDGLTWETAYKDIQSAVDAATAAGGEVWVAAGTYTVTTGRVLAMKANVSVYGGFVGTETARDQRDWITNITTIDGEDTRGCVSGVNYATIDGFNIIRGSANNGGGMYNSGCSPTVANCTFAWNSAVEYHGGGMYNTASSPLISNCTFTGNVAEGNGGGMFNASLSSPSVTGCTFTGNAATTLQRLGGAIFNGSSCSPTIQECVFTGNSGGYGGGIYNFTGAAPAIERCTFSGNSGTNMGGAIANVGGLPTITNCIFASNTTPGYGGAMSNEGSAVTTITNCTFVGNSAATNGGIHSNGATVVITNSIVWDNPVQEIFGSSYAITYSNIKGGRTGTGNINADPLFVNAPDNLRLQANSPCRNAGTTTDAPATDIEGTARPQGAGYDIGAYESITHTLTYAAGSHGSISSTTPQTVNHGDSGTAVTAVPDTGYHFVKWSDDSTENPRTDSNVTADISVTANFAINTYTLTYAAGENGTISGATPQTVNHGGSGTAVSAIPGTGYHFTQWSDASTENPRTDSNVTADISVTANFAINTYTLTYMTGSHGTISGATPQTVTHGSSGTAVTAVPDTGYRFLRWSDSQTQNPRTDTNVTSNITVNAAFSKNILRVDADSVSPTPNGLTWATAYADIQSAADAALALGGADLWVAARNYTASENPVLTMRQNVHVYGGFAGSETTFSERNSIANVTIIDGENLRRCIIGVNDGTLDGFTITRGYASGSSPDTTGAGMFNSSASPLVANCIFTENAAMGNGGGMQNLNSSPTVANCIFTGNSAEGDGGGMHNTGSSPVLTNCIFTSNSATTTGSKGGAMYNGESSAPILTNCTFTGNSAIDQGGAMRNWNSSPTIKNCIFWADMAANWAEFANSGSTPVVTYSCVQGGHTGAGNISSDPKFVSAPSNVRLQSSSPCISTGTATGAPATDIEGTARPQGAGYDMGAYEYIGGKR